MPNRLHALTRECVRVCKGWARGLLRFSDRLKAYDAAVRIMAQPQEHAQAKAHDIRSRTTAAVRAGRRTITSVGVRPVKRTIKRRCAAGEAHDQKRTGEAHGWARSVRLL